MLVDFHTHVLPGIDDGSASLEESIAMLQLQAAQGVTHVVATPHFYPKADSPEQFLQRRADAYAQLADARSQHPELPEIILGAEVAYFRGIGNCEALCDLQIGNTGFVLIEMPYGLWTDYMYRELEDISHKQGLTPIIAHVDRYLGWVDTIGIPRRLSQLPVFVQASSHYFLHPRTRGKALRMLKKGQIQLLGSDCHNLTDRVPNLGDALSQIQKKLGEPAMEYLLATQNAVLNTI